MTETPERHPTYFESRNPYQRLADVLPLVDKLSFMTEHGEAVNMGRVVRDALAEMHRLLVVDASFQDILDGTYVIVPKEPTEDMIAAGWIDKEDVSPADIYVAMIEAAQEQR